MNKVEYVAAYGCYVTIQYRDGSGTTFLCDSDEEADRAAEAITLAVMSGFPSTHGVPQKNAEQENAVYASA